MAIGALLTAAGIIGTGIFGVDIISNWVGSKGRRRQQGLADMLGVPKGPDLMTMLANEQDQSDTINAMERLQLGVGGRLGNLSLESGVNNTALQTQLSQLISQDSQRQIGELSMTGDNDPAVLMARLGLT